MQPGQNYSLTMADGTTKMVQVQNQTPDGVQVLDPNSGQSMMIPHVQPGAEPKPAQPSQPKMPNQGGNMTPPPNNGASPENVTSFALGLNDMKVTASEFGRTPNNCAHDGTHLNRKHPSDPEKFCPDCGMVYAASKTAHTPGPATVGKFYFCKQCNTSRTALLDRDGQEVHKALADGRVVRYLSCKHATPIDDSTVKPSWQPRGAFKKEEKIISEESECVNCGTSKATLNDKGECPKCARRRAFRTWKNREHIVRAFDIIKQADAPFAGQQAMPSGDVANEGQTITRDEKGPADFAEDPETQPRSQDPNAKRKLTPHEIIEEAESLIRNGLVKGVKMGAQELTEYMVTYYNNHPEELLQGIALAWQKVQYEEHMEGGEGDPNAPGGEGFGPQPPTTPEEAAQMAPRNGPIRTKSF
jgi:ribosomal protein S27AE